MKAKIEADLHDLVKGCRQLGLEVADRGIKKLGLYHAELMNWSKNINLIGKKQSPEQIIETHFLDSLLLLPYIQKNGEILIDVGSGAGFPGLVCKAALPELQLILIEPRLKRVSFLRHILRTLKLEGVEIIVERVENVPADSFTGALVTSRAVAEIDDFLRMVHHLIDNDTRIICMKGPKWKEEIAKASSALDDLKMELAQVDEFVLPFSGAKRALLSLRKI